MRIRKITRITESKKEVTKKPLVNETLKKAIMTGDKKLIAKAIKEISEEA